MSKKVLSDLNFATQNAIFIQICTLSSNYHPDHVHFLQTVWLLLGLQILCSGYFCSCFRASNVCRILFCIVLYTSTTFKSKWICWHLHNFQNGNRTINFSSSTSNSFFSDIFTYFTATGSDEYMVTLTIWVLASF